MSARTVVVVNKLSQMLPIAVTDPATGKPLAVSIDAGKTYGPIAESRLNAYTQGLAQQGHIAIKEYKPR